MMNQTGFKSGRAYARLDEQIQSIVVDDRRYQDAKNVAERFSRRLRKEKYQILEDISGADFQNAYQWMLQSKQSASLPPQISSPLLT
jgi:hypothetical protein